jgi:hypothetical protein
MKRLFFMTIVALLCFSGVTFAQQAKKAHSEAIVEVLYFHGKQRCVTCIAIGDNSKDVVNKDFAPQAKVGRVIFKEIDISTEAGEKMADKYRVSGSALYVNQWKNGKEQRNDMTMFGFENARNDTPAFRKGLKDKINQLLK